MSKALSDQSSHIRAADPGTAAIAGLSALPPQGSGPGILVLDSPCIDQAALGRFCERLSEEGYVVLAPTIAPSDTPDNWLTFAIDSIRRKPQHAGGIALVSFGDCEFFQRAVSQGLFDVAVLYSASDLTRLPQAPRSALTIHLDGKIPAQATPLSNASVFAYPDCGPGFAVPGHPAFDLCWAGMAYSRTLAALKRAIGPHYDLEELWEHHLACEFAFKDATQTMQTMVADPYVNHVPTMTGGVGHDLLKRFYKYHFVNQVPKSRRTIPISRTIGTDRIVDEKIFCFTHDCEIDWLLPGVAPTGRYVEIPLVGIITFRGDKLVNEHIYWDQASVLVQVGLLDPKGLPVCGREQARKLADNSLPSNELMPAWRTSVNKPL